MTWSFEARRLLTYINDRYDDLNDRFDDLGSGFKNTKIVRPDDDDPFESGYEGYILDGDITFSTPIDATNGLSITSAAPGAHTLTYTGTDPMIYSATSGSILLNSFTLSAPSASVFDCTAASGFETMTLLSVGFVVVDSMGELSGFRQLLATDNLMVNVDNGYTFSGTWVGGMKWDSLLTVSSDDLFIEGTSLVVGSRFNCDGNFQMSAGTSFVCDFSDTVFARDNSLQIHDALFTRNLLLDRDDAFYFPNIDETNVKCLWRDNSGIMNTSPGMYWQVTTETTTTISSKDTPVKMAGTTTTNHAVHFDDDGGTNNRTKLLSEESGTYDVEFHGMFDNSANKEFTAYLRKWDTSASSWSNVASSRFEILNFPGGGNDRGQCDIYTTVDLDEGDYIEVWIENNTNTSNVTAVLGALLKVKLT